MKNIKTKITAIILGIFTVVSLAGCSLSKAEDKDLSSRKYSYEKFLKVKIGMTYDETKKILGEGKKDTTQKSAEIYRWKNSDSSYIEVIYSGSTNKATEKIEYKLSNNKVKVSKEKYYEVNGKQNYQEVKDILGGEGTLTEEIETGKGINKTYMWGNDNDKNGYISVSFTNGYASFETGNYLK
ncbi:hypothetical protein NL50_07290 [Clostridium acetobutylicum]|nr:hypothetical protein NL50_07290 [Clostridium acetobutylicum]